MNVGADGHLKSMKMYGAYDKKCTHLFMFKWKKKPYIWTMYVLYFAMKII